eukprot:5996448-Pyramimonas_sp.AAC.1
MDPGAMYAYVHPPNKGHYYAFWRVIAHIDLLGAYVRSMPVRSPSDEGAAGPSKKAKKAAVKSAKGVTNP